MATASIYMGSTGAGNPIRRPSMCDLTIERFQWRETDRAAGLTPSVPEAAFVRFRRKAGHRRSRASLRHIWRMRTRSSYHSEDSLSMAPQLKATEWRYISAPWLDGQGDSRGTRVGRNGHVNTWLMAYGGEQTGELILEDDCNSHGAFWNRNLMRWQRLIGWISWKVLKFLDGGWIRKTHVSFH
jgi:hypothetical protein